MIKHILYNKYKMYSDPDLHDCRLVSVFGLWDVVAKYSVSVRMLCDVISFDSDGVFR